MDTVVCELKTGFAFPELRSGMSLGPQKIPGYKGGIDGSLEGTLTVGPLSPEGRE